jgi:hypothetical protein
MKLSIPLLIKHALAEIKNLKKKATKEEINKLVYHNFIPMSVAECIYGLMTGSCNSARAKELTPKTYKGGFILEDLKKGTYFTALELILPNLTQIKQKEIFNYLKGKQDNIIIEESDVKQRFKKYNHDNVDNDDDDDEYNY